MGGPQGGTGGPGPGQQQGCGAGPGHHPATSLTGHTPGKCPQLDRTRLLPPTPPQPAAMECISMYYFILFFSCSLKRQRDSMSECSVGCERWRGADHLRHDGQPWPTLSNAPFGSLQKQVSIMSLNLSAKIDEIQCHQHADTSAALHAIR